MYGIVAVEFDKQAMRFKRRWVTTSSTLQGEPGQPVCYESEEKAHTMAQQMTEAARECGIKNLGYRARRV